MTEAEVKRIIATRTPIDIIISVYKDRDYTEVIGTAGGDVLTYRVYNNGTIGER